MARLYVALLATSLVHVSQSLPQVVVDTDIGSDFDDTWAVTYLLSRSDPADPSRLFNFSLIQCSSFNTTARALIATKLLFDVDRFDVPVAVGEFTGVNPMPQLPVVGDWTLDDFTAAGGTLLYGMGALTALLAAATPSAPLFVVEIAPATSFGGVVGADPALTANAIVSAMSGSVYRGYNNNSTPQPEYNVVQNVSASQRMYAATYLSPMMTAPLDTSGLLHCFAPEFTALIAADNDEHPYAQALLKNYRVWCGCTPSPAKGTDTLYDAQAAVMVAQYAQEWVAHGSAPPPVRNLTLQALRLAVNDSGFTVVDPAAQTVWAAVGFPDGLAADTHGICQDLISHIIRAK